MATSALGAGASLLRAAAPSVLHLPRHAAQQDAACAGTTGNDGEGATRAPDRAPASAAADQGMAQHGKHA